ncbi:sugar transport protein [Salmonella enterica subsp. enterica]|uniref:Sugar transport protein n=1 Tax=Salmonella enterica I TaxID=59201 RepID=A0A379WG06_SALET|nr:sugar transport protein [Salmonella enterica subsp. enterica]
MSTSQFAWAQVPVFGAVIVANMIVVRLVKDPTRPRFIWRAVPIQLSGLATLLLGNLLLRTSGFGLCWAPACTRSALA